MRRWTITQANKWYDAQSWLIGCNFLPSTAINQLEMFQAKTYDPETINRELGWAQDLGFNTLRVYLHDLLWHQDSDGFSERLDDFLRIAEDHGIRPLLVLFDDCHRTDPELGTQPLPVSGVHNSGWKQSPGHRVVHQFDDGTVSEDVQNRLKDFVQGVLSRFSGDERILMWDLYNEPGQNGNNDKTFALLSKTWQWAKQVRPSQPLTACLAGTAGEKNIALNAAESDIITFHCYWKLEEGLMEAKELSAGRPMVCTEYMARELGTTFQNCLPIFKTEKIGCYNWGLVAGKSQTHFNWQSTTRLKELWEQKAFLHPGDPIPEPELWFHDIFRIDGTPFDPEEVACIKKVTGT